MEKRLWIRSGIVEELDQRQAKLLALVYQKIVFYYQILYRTRSCYQYPLSLSRLMKLCNRSASTVGLALRFLANTVPLDSKDSELLVYYDRAQSARNKTHRPYRIFLRKKYD